jgi:prepilin-type N-terminal cleavage/methylation domain-containing protein
MKSPTVGTPFASTERANSNFQRLKQRRETGEIDGFTLIEILIVIIVLGILAAVVIFALGGVTGQSAQAACAADGATVSTAIASYNSQNPATPLTTANYLADLTTSDTDNQNNGPYIQSWPSNSPHYQFGYTTALGLTVAVPSSGAAAAYTGPSSCSAVS